eukprot:g32787.t1
MPSWGPGGALVALVLALALSTCPSLSSFKTYCSHVYGQEEAIPSTPTKQGLSFPDHSFEPPVKHYLYYNYYVFAYAKQYLYYNYYVFAYAKVKQEVKVQVSATSKKKSQIGKGRQPSAHHYVHRHLGMFDKWVTMPYLPHTGSERSKQNGLGLCLQGHCVCLPAVDAVGRSQCQAMDWEQGTVLMLLMAANGAGLLVVSLPAWSSFMFKNCLSLYNLQQGRFSCLVVSTFLTQNLFSLFTKCSILMTVSELLESRGSDLLLALLYLGGAVRKKKHK